MTAKEYLQQSCCLARGIKMKLERIQKLRELAEGATRVFTEERETGTSRRGKLGSCTTVIADLEQEVADDVAAMRVKIHEIQEAVGSIENLAQRQLLELRYINGYTWERVAVEMNYTHRHVIRMHGEALKKIRCPFLSLS